jgi:hypothetical protein
VTATRTFHMSIPDDAWANADYDDDGLTDHRLLATLVVNGSDLHLEAHLLWPTTGAEYLAREQERLRLIRRGVGADGPWRTTIIRGRTYVLVATPYCD